MKLTFYTKHDCELCEAAWFVVTKVAGPLGVEVHKVDITAPEHDRWYELYKHDIPVVCLDGREIFRHRITERELRRRIQEHT